MSTTIGGKIELDGAAHFKNALRLAKEQAKGLQSQMCELASQFTDSGRSADELQQRNKLLTDAMNQQRSTASYLSTELGKQRDTLTNLQAAVNAAREKYENSSRKVEEATRAYGENSDEVKAATKEQENNEKALAKAANSYTRQALVVGELEREYTDAQTQINSMTNELEDNERTIRDIERGYNDAGNQVDEFGNEVKNAEDDVKDLGRNGESSVAKLSAAFAAAELAVDLARKAVSTLKSHLGDAIDRFDTLNNFPKILQQMGFSADQAETATKRLSDGVQGLPTSLDSVVDTAQRLTILTGNLESATETTIALNNAFIASGSDASKAERGLEQYVKMLSSGEVNLQSWRALQETMGLALNETAKAFGFAGASAQNDLYEALKSGDVTFDQFNSKIVELSEGVDGFAERALTASGGIKTSITNFGTAITRNLTDLLYIVDDLLADTRFGSIEGVISAAKDAVNALFGQLKERLPQIISFVSDLYTKVQPFIPLILLATTAFTAFSTALRIKDLVLGVVKAFQIFNATLLANPVLAVISIIAGLVAALIYLWKTNDTFREAVISAWSKVKAAVSGVVNTLKTFFTETIPGAWNSLVDFLKSIPDWWNGFWESIAQFFIDKWNEVIRFFTVKIPDFIRSIIEGFNALPERIGFALGQVAAKIVLLGQSIKEWITTELPRIIGDIAGWFAELPGRVWEHLKETLAKTTVWAIETTKKMTNAAKEAVLATWNGLRELPGRVWGILKETIAKAVDWGAEMAKKAKDGAVNTFNNIVDTIKGLPGRALDIGKDLVRGLWEGITGMGTWLKDKIRGFADGIIDGFKKGLGINSPSTKTKAVARWLAPGIVEGVKDTLPRAIHQIEGMMDSTAAAFATVIPMTLATANDTLSGIPEAQSGSGGGGVVLNLTLNIEGEIGRDREYWEYVAQQAAEPLSEILAQQIQRREAAVGG